MINEQQKFQILGKNIAGKRKQRKLSQRELAERLGITREHLAKIEIAKKGISLGLLFRICDVLNVKESELFKF